MVQTIYDRSFLYFIGKRFFLLIFKKLIKLNNKQQTALFSENAHSISERAFFKSLLIF